MTIQWTGTGGLFTRLGALGKILKDANVYAATTLPTNISAVRIQYENIGSGSEPDLTASLGTDQSSGQSTVNNIGSSLQGIAKNTVLRMVADDNPQSSSSDLSIALAEVVRQMRANSQTVKSCTVSAAIAVVSGNTGTGTIAAHTKRGDGLTLEQIFAEVGKIKCVGDAYSGGSTSGNESFQFFGMAPLSNPFDHNWGGTAANVGGSGGVAFFTAIDGSKDNSSGNLLTNSDFEDWTGNTPNNWAITTGAAGTEILKSTATFYDGLASLQIVGGATLTALTQTFDVSSNGTAGELAPNTVYGVNLWAKVSSVPAAGSLTVELIDGSGTVVTDDQAANNAFTINLTTLTTSFAAYNGFFRTPKLLPTTVKLRLRLNNALSGGSNLFIDRLGMGVATQAYFGGPYLAAFSGVTAFLLNDQFTLTTANDRGGATYNANFQTLFDRFFGMKALGLLLPSASAGNTISDSLVG